MGMHTFIVTNAVLIIHCASTVFVQQRDLFRIDILRADLLDWLVDEDDKQHSEDLPIYTRPFAVRVWWVHRGAGYGAYTEEQSMVGTQMSRVWWVHRGAGYGGYTEEQGKVGTQRSRVWWVHRGAGYCGYTGVEYGG